MNFLRHAGRAKVTDVVSDILGVPEGRVVEHWDGRTDAHVAPSPVRVGPDEVEAITGLPLNDLRRLIYDYYRGIGFGHEECLARVFRDGKVTA